MHILVFIHSLSGGGAERVTVNLANYWAGLGRKVTIVTLVAQSQDAYTLAPEIRRISLNLAADSTSTFAALRNNFRRVRALRTCLRQEKPDIALAMMTSANCLLALAGRQGAKKIIGSEHIYPPQMPLGRFWETARKRLYGRLDSVAVLTRESQKWLSENTNAKKAAVIANPAVYPLRGSAPHIAPHSVLNPDRKILLSVGRLEEQKSFPRLLEVFARLSNDFPEWDLAIIGEGTQRPQLEDMVRRTGISDRVILPGHAGNIADWYNAADAYAMTSLFEGFPNVLVEAMAYGLPPVSVDCDTGPRDIIINNQNGLLVEQNNPQALENALRRMLGDDKLRQKLAYNAVDVRARFSFERIGKLWDDLF